MYTQRRVGLVLLASLMLIAVSAATASAQFVVGFEAPTYVTGSLQDQDQWAGGPNFPRVQTGAEIAAELTAAGLNPANPLHSGEQALLWTYTPGETQGGFLRRPFTGLETETHVVMDFWARPLTPGAEGSTIGFNQGNTFAGIMDNNETRAAAFRFGVVRDAENNITGTTIDYASATAGTAVWIPSGLTWAADTWYNFRFDLDYEEKQYDFYVNDTKVATDFFYNTSSEYAARVFISRGTNQAGQIIDDISVVAAGTPAVPGDFDGDGDVDGADFVVWQTNFPKAEGGTLDTGDADGDGDVDGADFVIWQTNFPFTPSPGATVVPEPASVILALGGIIALARRRSRAVVCARPRFESGRDSATC